MKNIVFEQCSSSLATDDLDVLENLIAAFLPADFKSHYLRWNGGMPSLDWFPAQPGWEPIWLSEFIPIDTPDEKPSTSIGGIYMAMTKKNIIQKDALPFAIDPGNNFLCLDLKDGSVFYHANDVFDAALSSAENQRKAQRRLTDSFSEFVDALVSEDDAFD